MRRKGENQNKAVKNATRNQRCQYLTNPILSHCLCRRCTYHRAKYSVSRIAAYTFGTRWPSLHPYTDYSQRRKSVSLQSSSWIGKTTDDFDVSNSYAFCLQSWSIFNYHIKRPALKDSLHIHVYDWKLVKALNVYFFFTSSKLQQISSHQQTVFLHALSECTVKLEWQMLFVKPL